MSFKRYPNQPRQTYLCEILEMFNTNHSAQDANDQQLIRKKIDSEKKLFDQVF